MLDIHTHILPDMDDGSRSLKQSMIMLRREAKQKVDRVVLTPHFYAYRESPDRFLRRRKASVKALKQMMAGKNKLPQIVRGAEVAYFNGMSRVEGIERLSIGQTDAMLIEMPFCKWNRSMIGDLIFLKESRGIQPILAHIERYLRYQPFGTIEQLCEAGIWIQASASFFSRWQTSWLAMRMLKQRKIQFIGSDCHNTKDRPPNMADAYARIEKRLGRGAIKYLSRMERRLIEGE